MKDTQKTMNFVFWVFFSEKYLGVFSLKHGILNGKKPPNVIRRPVIIFLLFDF
jgi:hypothetical protein